MTQDQLADLQPGVYRLFWHSGGSSVAAVGLNRAGRHWFAAANWTSGPSLDWSKVLSISLIDVQNRELLTMARRAVEIANAYGRTECCCECGEDYPRADLLRGDIYCPKCRKETP